MPGMPFNQMMTFPCELTLRTTPEGIRMFAQPVKEIETLHARSHVCQDVAVAAGKPLGVPVAGDLFDIRAEFQLGPAKAFGLTVGGRKIAYNVGRQTLEGMPSAARGRQDPDPAPGRSAVAGDLRQPGAGLPDVRVPRRRTGPDRAGVERRCRGLRS